MGVASVGCVDVGVGSANVLGFIYFNISAICELWVIYRGI